jgi:hypothetical protein
VTPNQRSGSRRRCRLRQRHRHPAPAAPRRRHDGADRHAPLRDGLR